MKNNDYLPEEEIRALGPKEVVCIPSGMGGLFDVHVTTFGDEIRFKYAYKKDPDGWGQYISKIRMTVEQAVGFVYRRVEGKGRTMCQAKGRHEFVNNLCLLCEEKQIEMEESANA